MVKGKVHILTDKLNTFKLVTKEKYIQWVEKSYNIKQLK